MGWMNKLYDTYEHCANNPLFENDANRFFLLEHIAQNAHIEVVIDRAGVFLRAGVVDKADAVTTIPRTDESASRSGVKPVPHPLCDKLQYLARDFRAFGGTVTKGFQKDEDQPHRAYLEQLEAWARASPHPKLAAILYYVRSGTLVADLIKARILPVDQDGQLLKSAKREEKKAFLIWSVLSANQPPENAFVRWKVEIPGQPDSGTWQDSTLAESWVCYVPQLVENRNLCMATGREQVPVAHLHPSKLRHDGDRAKLISANDKMGFTYRGRFTDSTGLQACSVGRGVTQKAHQALAWLIRRQGYRNGTQAYVSWAVSGAPMPSPLADTRTLMPADLLTEIDAQEPDEIPARDSTVDHSRDLGQAFALRLKKAMRGYSAGFGPADEVVIMGIDSDDGSKGRLGIIYYRELTKSDFLERIERWHTELAWPQRAVTDENPEKKTTKSSVRWPIGAPAPKLIAKIAYGRRVDDKLRGATISRLLACIIDGRGIPWDLVGGCVRRVSNRLGFDEDWQWEEALAVACAMYKGYCRRTNNPEQRRGYAMTLEQDRNTRDYLYGRLLAVADQLESRALYLGGERRSTTAARLMQRFADRPYSTWRTIALALQPYTQRLGVSRPGYLHTMQNLLDDIHGMFSSDEYTDDSRLSGEFLLGYHCQVQALKHRDQKTEDISEKEPQDDRPAV